MTTIGYDSYSLPRFEERLWAELSQAYPDAGRSGGSGRLGGVDRLEPTRRSRPGRRPGARRYLVAMAALAAASAVIVAVVVADDRNPDTEAGEATPNPQRPNGGSPDPSASREPTAAPDAVVVEVSRYADGSTVTHWRDEATGDQRMLRQDSAGAPQTEQVIKVIENPDGTFSATGSDLDHVAQEYSTLVPPDPRTLQQRRADDELRALIEDGSFVADGTGPVDGVDLLRFVGPSPMQAVCADSSTGTSVTWADPATFHPVRMVVCPGTDSEWTKTYSYLERTPENLALIDLHIPAGYREVDILGRDVN